MAEFTSNPDDIPGLKPEDIEITPKQSAMIEAFKKEQQEAEDEWGDIPELTDAEFPAVYQLGLELTAKYGSRYATYETLSELRKEATDRYRDLGFEITVDWILSGLIGTDTEPPTISIMKRIEGNPYDPGRNRYELSKGKGDQYWADRKGRLGK